MLITISRTTVFRLSSAISCSPLSGRFSWVLCIWRSSSLWLDTFSLALLLILCCMSHCSPLQDHFTHLLFQLVFNLDILVSCGDGAFAIHRRNAWLPSDKFWILWTTQRFGRFCMARLVCFLLPTLQGSKFTIVYRVLLTFALIFVLIRGIMGARRGEAVTAPMVEV
jgi:hypothetical protein